MTIKSFLVLLAAASITAQASAQPVESWLTNPDRSALFARQNGALRFKKEASAQPAIRIDPEKRFQSMDGFGYTLTGGSAMHLMRMSPSARAALMEELFGTMGRSIGVSYLRVSIGASDLNERVFSYDDVPPGETDPELKRFDLGPDRADVVPALKEALAVNPDLKILGSPWSPPAWMKTNGDTRGGSLKPEFYAAYAQYFVKYIKAMKAEGIPIDAITVQNEPLHPGNNPSLLMLAPDQARFIKEHLGPAFEAAGLRTKIIIYDHNADHPEYPLSILDDPAAKKYVDGSAFHLYAGSIEVLSKVHEAHPDRHVYFTEQWIGAPGDLKKDLAWHTRQLIIGASRNWSRTVLEWNLAADPNQKPHTDRGGCDRCLGAITLDGDKVTRNPAYYIIAHAARFVRPGSVRIDSTMLDGLPNVAFQTSDGRKVLIVLNETNEEREFGLEYEGKSARTRLEPGAVGTFVW